LAGKLGWRARPSSPRSQKLWTLTFRSANSVAVVSVGPSKTLILPLFSATKMRPSDANSMLVGLSSPLHTTSSSKPVGRLTARPVAGDSNVTSSTRRTRMPVDAHAWRDPS
jgi:hypothetical protein